MPPYLIVFKPVFARKSRFRNDFYHYVLSIYKGINFVFFYMKIYLFYLKDN